MLHNRNSVILGLEDPVKVSLIWSKICQKGWLRSLLPLTVCPNYSIIYNGYRIQMYDYDWVLCISICVFFCVD